VHNRGQHRLEALETVKDLDDAKHTKNEHHIQYLVAVEAVPAQLFDYRDEKRRSDDDHVEDVPQFSREHDTAEAVDFEHNFEDEYGKESEFEPVQIEEDEDRVEHDNGIEKVAERSMLDNGLNYGGCSRGVEVRHFLFENVGEDFDDSNVE